jgi:hypothetical protein
MPFPRLFRPLRAVLALRVGTAQWTLNEAILPVEVNDG